MLEALERLLILQDRDRKISLLGSELAELGPQRHQIQSKVTGLEHALETIRIQARQIESDRKRLELEVDSKKQQIEKYSIQQFQTKKNEEYRALAHEIEMARAVIRELEDQQLLLMEQGESAHRELIAAQQAATEAGELSEQQLADLEAREQNVRAELNRLQSDRDQLASQVDEAILPRYERLRCTKGERVLVGIANGVCGGCHMRLPAQVLISCRSDQDLVACTNCGRILYYTPDMNLIAAD
jgi:predicted  nucleic acid-binding Zn-ribbon protein